MYIKINNHKVVLIVLSVIFMKDFYLFIYCFTAVYSSRIMHHVGIVALSALFVVSVHCSSLELLLREIEELDHMERDVQINKRVSDVMALLTAPIERNALLERGVEGEMCEDGVKASK